MSMMDEKGWQVFKALGEPNRFQLLFQLCRCATPASVSQLADTAPQDQSVISRHLKTMREAGVLLSEKKGRETLYQVNAKRLAESLRQLATLLENCECCRGCGSDPAESRRRALSDSE